MEHEMGDKLLPRLNTISKSNIIQVP